MKKVSLNKNSWHFKYYSWINGSDAPKTLCPYFWTMVTMILLSPIFVFVKLLSMLSIYLEKKSDIRFEKKLSNKNFDSEKEYNKLKKRNQINENIGKGLAILMCLLFLFLIGFILYDASKEIGWHKLLKNIFAFIGLLTTMTLTLFGLVKLRLGSKIINSKFIQIPKAMIIAVYTKACPLVEWKNN